MNKMHLALIGFGGLYAALLIRSALKQYAGVTL